MNQQHKYRDEEMHLGRSPSFRDESFRKSFSAVEGAAGDDWDGEFEFSISGPLEDPADEIFANGQILPVFKQRLPKSYSDPDMSLQLRALSIADRAELRSGSQASTSSSAESDSLEIDSSPAPQSPSRGKKSSSTGFESVTRKWRDLIGRRRRCHSYGGSGSGSGLSSTIASPKKKEEKSKKKKPVKEMDLVTAHNLFYGGGKDKKDGEYKVRRSFLPYKPELVPLFTNLTSHRLHPF